MSKIREEYNQWLAEEKAKGLKYIKLLCVENSENITLDEFLTEFMAANKAVKEGKYTEFPKSL